MTKNEIISNLFTGKNFRDCIAKMEPVRLQEDLRQEVALIICELPEEKLYDLHDNGKLEYYVVRVILNLTHNSSNQFYKKFRLTWAELTGKEFAIDHDDYSAAVARKTQITTLVDESEAWQHEEREIREAVEDLAMQEIDRLYWYDAELLRIYLRVGNFRAMGEETGIPYISCYKSVKKSMRLLKEKAEAARPLFTKKELSFIQNNRV